MNIEVGRFDHDVITSSLVVIVTEIEGHEVRISESSTSSAWNDWSGLVDTSKSSWFSDESFFASANSSSFISDVAERVWWAFEDAWVTWAQRSSSNALEVSWISDVSLFAFADEVGSSVSSGNRFTVFIFSASVTRIIWLSVVYSWSALFFKQVGKDILIADSVVFHWESSANIEDTISDGHFNIDNLEAFWWDSGQNSSADFISSLDSFVGVAIKRRNNDGSISVFLRASSVEELWVSRDNSP